MKMRRFKPGSVDSLGNVIDYRGNRHYWGPCFIPDDISPARKGLLGAAGWCITPSSLWPSMLPHEGLACIYRPKAP